MEKVIKYYQTLFGPILAEEIEEGERYYVLKNAATMRPVRQVGNDVEMLIVQFFPKMITNHKELHNRFNLKKSMVIFSGPADHNMVVGYEDFCRKLSAEIAGIHLVSKPITLATTTEK